MGGGEPATDPGPLPHVSLLDVWLSEHGLPSTPHTPATSGGPEMPAAAGLLHLVGEYMIKKGAGVVVVGGWVLAAGSVIWEAFHLGTWAREVFDAPDPREVRREAWRHYMRQHFWMDYPPLSNALREAAFDALVGDQASHGITPLMTREALFKAQELENQISDRWLGHLSVIQALEEYIAKAPPHAGGVTVPDHPDAPAGGGYSVVLSSDYRLTDQQAVELARKEIERAKAAMADDMKALVEFETDPANWALTPEQQAMLPDKPAGA